MPAAANPDPTTQPRDFLLHLFQAAVARAQPAQVLAGFLPPPPQGRTVVLGAGNAAGGYVVTERMLEMFKSSKKEGGK